MKLTLRFTLCLTLVLTLLFTCAVSPMALSATMTHVYDSGTVQYLKGTYAYTTDSAASYKLATATLTFGTEAAITARIEAFTVWGGIYNTNVGADAIYGTYVQASTNSIFSVEGSQYNGDIVYAYATYVIAGKTELSYEVY